MFLNQVSQDKTKTNNRTKEKAIKKILSFRDLMLFQRTRRRRFWSTAADSREETWASGCSKPGRKWYHAHYRGECFSCVFYHIWKQVTSTRANTFGSNGMWWVWKALSPHLWLAARLYCKHSYTFQSHIGGCNPSPTIQPRKHSYTTIQFHANPWMYVHTCVYMLS